MNRRRGPVTAALALALALTALVMTVQSVGTAGAQVGPEGVTGQGADEPARGVPGGSGARQPAPPAADELGNGRQLYLTSCVNCHGADGLGTPGNPPLTASGEAKADFYLRTGRMPLTVPVPQPPAKLPAFNDEQIRQLVAYVGSLCAPGNECPRIPTLDLERARIEAGQQLFLANCAPCHNSAAIGGALSYGRHAPSLQETPPTQVAEAIRTGPGQMPRFGPDVIDDGQVNAIVKYVQYLREPENPGGLPLGNTGPVAEGFVALLIGLGVILVAARWITREPEHHTDDLGEAVAELGATEHEKAPT
jgi:ubiquinol-cytochrome c reductase cytochrome c subunit